VGIMSIRRLNAAYSKLAAGDTKCMTRKEANDAILINLKYYLEAYPDMRFGQALVNLNIVKSDNSSHNALLGVCLDPFYDESEDTLKRMGENQ